LTTINTGDVVTAAQINQWCPAGMIVEYGGVTAPSGWFICDGSSVSRATYPALFAALVRNMGAVTVTIATPGVFAFTNHGLVAGDSVFLETTGALPTGLTADTTYYVIATGLTANNFELSATPGGAAINTSGSQSGTHTLFFSPYGVANASTLNLPDTRGRMGVGYAPSGGHADTASMAGNDGGAVANRRSRHRTTNTLTGTFSGTTSGPNQNIAESGGTGALGGGASLNATPTATHTHTYSGSVTFSGSIGTNVGADPLDTPSYYTANKIIRAKDV
jgi:hypothetical protein